MLNSPPYFLELFGGAFVLCFAFGKYCSNEKLWAKWFPETGKDAYEVYAKRGEYGEYERAKKGDTELKGSPFKEPWNAWTSLMYSVFGMVIFGTSVMDCLRVYRGDSSSSSTEAEGLGAAIPNRQAAYPEFGVLYGLSSIWLGIASFLFHASHAEPWRKADAGMTSGVVIANVVYGLWDRLRPPGVNAFVLVLLGALLQFSLTHGYLPYGSSDVLLPSLVIITMVIEFLPRYGGPVEAAGQYQLWFAVLYAVLTGLLLRLADVKRDNKTLYKRYLSIVAVMTIYPFGYSLGYVHPIIIFGILGLAWVLKDASRGHIWWHFGSSYALFGWWYMMRTRPGNPVLDTHSTDTLWATLLFFGAIKNACRRIFMVLPFPSDSHRDRTFYFIEHVIWSYWGYYAIFLEPNSAAPGSSWLYAHENLWKLPTFPSNALRLYYYAKTAGAVEDLIYRWVAVRNSRAAAAAAAAAASSSAAAAGGSVEAAAGSSDKDSASLLQHRSASSSSSSSSSSSDSKHANTAVSRPGTTPPAGESHAPDFKMDVHHVTTAILCVGSLYFGFTRIGSAIMFVHDLTDIPLDLVRLFGCFEWFSLQAVSMLVTLGMWGYWRLYFFPCYLLYSTVFDHKEEVFGHECRYVDFKSILYFDVDCKDATGFPHFENWCWVFLIFTLVVLHYIWYGMMVRKTYQELWGGGSKKAVAAAAAGKRAAAVAAAAAAAAGSGSGIALTPVTGAGNR